MIKIITKIMLFFTIVVMFSGCEYMMDQLTNAYAEPAIIKSVTPLFPDKYIDVNIYFPGRWDFTKIYYITAWYIKDGEHRERKIEFADNHAHDDNRFTITSYDGNIDFPANARVYMYINATSTWTTPNAEDPSKDDNHSVSSQGTFLWEKGVVTRLN